MGSSFGTTELAGADGLQPIQQHRHNSPKHQPSGQHQPSLR
ncbi:hypothetical protein RBWH47_05802 [Rhodopirellula baltica WH47]|uniref:Uncharacterized protein n=1 Tax=Rhodopirellula baltica WH47 TaxID=991778 RepID=F2AZ67_RHOBT|nr:hypothetical protein RBWH47_05802 [Rhodopirellula baltica WH47]